MKKYLLTDASAKQFLLQGKAYAALFGVVAVAFSLQFAFGGTATSSTYSPLVDVTIVDGVTTVCAFENTQKGALQIIKNTIGIPAKFYYHLIPTPSIITVMADREIDDDQYTSHGQNKNKMLLEAGKYPILEVMPNDRWIMKDVSCVILPEGCGDEICDADAGEDCNTCLTDCGTCSSLTPLPPPVCDDFDDDDSDCILDELEEDDGEGVRENDITSATRESGEPNIGFSGSVNSIWYHFTPDADKQITIDTCSNTTDTVMSLRNCAKTTGATGDTAPGDNPAVTITDGGSCHQTAPVVKFSGGNCTTQPKGKATIFDGVVTGVVIETPGDGCTTGPTAVTFTPPPENPFGVEIAFDDDSCPFSAGSKITYRVAKDIEYYLAVDGYKKLVGPITLNFKEGPPPVYDPLPPPPPEPGSTGKRMPTRNGIEEVEIVNGRTTACTFENELMALKIVTQTIGGRGDEEFDYVVKKYDVQSPTIEYSKLNVFPDQNIREDRDRGDEYTGSQGIYLQPATTSYLVTQELPEGWALNSAVCHLQDGKEIGARTIYTYGIGNITLEANRITTCTFINTKKGELNIVNKATDSTGEETFNYDIGFKSSEYFSPGVLPFSLPPFSCNDGTCSASEDCNICNADCNACSSPSPKPPGPAYSPTRITLKPNKDDTKEIYPGIYDITAYLPSDISGKQNWTPNKVDCKIDKKDSAGNDVKKDTGSGIGGGITDVQIFAGKTTTCAFTNSLSTVQRGGGGERGQSEEEKKQDQN